jgi:1-deoxy-D-xylulose-5-phosphate reductoisomerase
MTHSRVKKRVAVLGATGSIGKNTLDILRNCRDSFEPVLFTSNRNGEELLKLKKEFPSVLTAMADKKSNAHGVDFRGEDGILEAIARAGAEITVNGIAGAAGLLPSEAVIKAGSDLALANKETVVMAGEIIFALAKEKKVQVIPVDSEHSALFKLLESHGSSNTEELILTASGGPFRNRSPEELVNVTLEEALVHPTWNMGPKISIDSATLANKGLEVIEAAFLFSFPPEKIKVVIHPQSIVHSMIRLKNGAVYAQMSKPDMRLPIHDALFWPRTEPSPFGALDLDSLSLNFEKADFDSFPMLALAYKALKDALPAVYNAANETAVEAFTQRRIGFLEISRLVRYVLDKTPRCAQDVKTIGTVLEKDREARSLAQEYIRKRS